MLQADVVIIGAGAVGTAIARELSKYVLKVILVDKNEDVGGDASKSNSAIIHTGFDASPDTLESQLVVSANPMYDQITKELDIPFKRIGAILTAVTQEEFSLLNKIKEKAYKNRVYDVDYLSPQAIKALEPEVTDKVLGGLYIPRESIIDPFLLVIAQAENAVENGVKILLSTMVTDITVKNGQVQFVKTNQGTIQTKFVINAAGLFCDKIAEIVGLCNFKEHPRKGQFYVLDKNVPYKVNRIILPVPTKLTKGKLACPTIHGNLLIGPTAEELEDRFDKAVTAQGLQEVIEGVRKLVPKISKEDAIKQYCGLRPVRTPEGYHIEAYKEVKGFIGISGIRSTGVTSSVAVARYVTNVLNNEGLDLIPKPDFNPYRIGIKKFSELSDKEKEQLIKENPKYGHVICRCETVTEAEIVEAIRRPVGAKSMDGIKRRVRAGMGRCQGGFCSSRVLDILSRELNIPAEKVTKNEAGSELVIGKIR
ncbi:MAG: glycerol-3-phosphate dehydrogenase [Clostridiales bacterium]|nr:glycerol-3-phosphate dehydrogenase [Clostridiales bacterium]MDK2933867.1 glycerol-3-phosphate dehydrogenase [Clostridiales bacterium]